MILALAFAAAAASPATGHCYRPAAGEVVIERRLLSGRTAAYEAVSVSRRLPNGALDGRMLVFNARCAHLFERGFDRVWEVRFQTVRLGGEPVLVATGISPGASSSGYHHVLLAY